MAKLTSKVPTTLLHKAQRWAVGLIGLTVAAMLVSAVASGQQALQGGWAAIPWGAIGILLLATVAESILRAWRYVSTGKALGLGVPTHLMLYYYVVGYGLIPIPGKAGTFIRLWLLKKRQNLNYGRTAPIFVMDFITDALAGFGLCAIALACLPEAHWRAIGLLVGAALLVAVCGILLAPKLLEGSLKLACRLLGKRKMRLFAKLLKLIRTTRNVLGPKILAVTFAQSFIGWALVGAATAYLVTAFGTPLSLAQGTAAAMITNIGGFLSLMPAGTGGAEVSLTGMLAVFGTPMATAVLVTTIWRLIVMWLSVVVGLVALPFALRAK